MNLLNCDTRILIIQRCTDLFAGHVEFIFIGIVLIYIAGQRAKRLLGDKGKILSHFESSFLN